MNMSSLELGEKCYGDYINGATYEEIAQRRGLKSRGSVAGYIFRYRLKNQLLPRIRTIKSAVKTRAKNKGNPQAIRKANAAIPYENASDIVTYTREDGVRVTKDTKPRMAWGYGYDWKGI